jgi:hypothetical protein
MSHMMCNALAHADEYTMNKVCTYTCKLTMFRPESSLFFVVARLLHLQVRWLQKHKGDHINGFRVEGEHSKSEKNCRRLQT